MNRRGVALGLVLWTLVIGSALLTVAVFIGAHERRVAGSDQRLQRAIMRAELRLTDAVAGWSPGLLTRRLVRPFDSVVVGNLDPSWQGMIRRLNRGLFLVSVAAEDPAAASVATVATLSRLGWLVRVRPVEVASSAALQAGRVALSDGARITGMDQPPAGWDCPPPDSAVAGILAGEVDNSGSPSIAGSPPIALSPGDTSFPQALESAFAQLVAQATLGLPGGTWSPRPSVVGTDCDISDASNWGDVRPGACGDYWPIVHIQGDLQLARGTGHGILLVDGDLQVIGVFEFTGLVLVRGGVDIDPSIGSLDLRGSLIASSTGVPGRRLSGITITYSKCMIDNALLSSGTLIPLRSRAWKQLF